MKLIAFFIIIIIVSCIVPFFQWLTAKIASSKTREYIFSEQLFDFKMNGLSFESKDDDRYDRFKLANRGWVRFPAGKVVTKEEFEQQKLIEYKKELP